MELSVATIGVSLAGVFVIAFMKGAFGGGFAIVGIPLLSLVMDPLTAGALLAPLFVVMDVLALRYWKPSTWSKPDLKLLVPSLIIGIGLGYLALRVLDHRAVAIVMALITLAFTALWFQGGGQVTVLPRSTRKAIAAGVGSGVTTMMTHSGGPPLAMYLLPLGLTKEIYAGTEPILHSRECAQGGALAVACQAEQHRVGADGDLALDHTRRRLDGVETAPTPEPTATVSSLLRTARRHCVETAVGRRFRVLAMTAERRLGVIRVDFAMSATCSVSG